MDLGFINEIPQDIFNNLEQIGSGSFSDIFTAIHVKTNCKVALKITMKGGDDDYLKKEINIFKSLNHPFICKYFTDIETEHLKIVAMELVDGPNALDYVNKYSGLPMQEAQSFFAQLVIAIEYLHSQKVSHRDLKLENIMLDKYGHIRLIDFGFSSLNTIMTTCCGSIPYTAPEVLMGENYTNAADIWSLGIILYAFIQGGLPFYHSNIYTLAMIICQCDVEFTSSFDKESKDLITKMLEKDPEKRISLDDIKNHPYVSSDRLLKINYKQLFSPKEKNQERRPSLGQIQKPENNTFVNKADNKQDQVNIRKSSTCITFNLAINNNLHPQNIYHTRNRRISSNEMAHKLTIIALQEKITEQNNNIEDAILSRNDFAFNLNRLIELSTKIDKI